MSPHLSALPWPGPGRITLALLAAIPAAMAYPWPTTRDRWVLGAAVVLLILLLGWWRGLHLTTILRRRLAMLRRRGGVAAEPAGGPDVRTTALLHVLPAPTGPDTLPLALIAGYLNRYGLRADTVRITSCDTTAGTDEPVRDTWIGLTVSAADNLAALRARSARIPLRETAEAAARRLADHLRELGWEVTAVGADEVPVLFDDGAREGWRGVTGSGSDCVAAYRIAVDHGLADTLAEVRSYGAPVTWTAVEFAGDGDHRTVAAGCALGTAAAAGASPLAGLVPQHGNHRAALAALSPAATRRLDGHTGVADGFVAALSWPVLPEPVSARPRAGARHAAVS